MADQIHYTFSSESKLANQNLQIIAVTGHQALSQLYQFNIHFLINQSNSTKEVLDELDGLRVSISIEKNQQSFDLHGILTDLTEAEQHPMGIVFSAMLMPQLWQTTLTNNSAVYVGLTSEDIVKTILERNRIAKTDYTFCIKQYLPSMPFRCQYQESDFNFINRILEHDGISYFFEHGNHRERIIFTDDIKFYLENQNHPHNKPASAVALKFNIQHHATAPQENSINHFIEKRSTLPKVLRIRAHHINNPGQYVEANSTSENIIIDPRGAGEILLDNEYIASSEYGESEQALQKEIKRLLKLRAEALIKCKKTYSGSSNYLNLSAGHSINLSSHPYLDGSYLITEVNHYSYDTKFYTDKQQVNYYNTFHAVPANINLRPSLLTPKPSISGTIEAQIDTEDAILKQLDTQGRYKVIFHFDKEDKAKPDGYKSGWIPVMQPYGSGEGKKPTFHFPLEKGTPVLISFINGNPDQPVITGVIAKGNIATNQIHTQGELIINTEGSYSKTVKGTEYKYIRGNKESLTTGSQINTVKLGQQSIIEQDKTETIKGNSTNNIGGNKTENITKNKTANIEGSEMVSITGNKTSCIKGKKDETIAGDSISLIQGDNKNEVFGKKTSITYGDSEQIFYGKTTQTYQSTDALCIGEYCKYNLSHYHKVNLTTGTTYNLGLDMVLSLIKTEANGIKSEANKTKFDVSNFKFERTKYKNTSRSQEVNDLIIFF